MPRSSWIARAFLTAERGRELLGKALHAVYQGLWLGLLDPSDLNQVTQAEYLRQGRYESRLHNLAGLFGWEEIALKEHFAGCRSILVAAAGGGREVIALTRLGFQVQGFECCPELLAVCRQLLADECIQAMVSAALPDQVPEGLGTFDGIIVGWLAYSHIAGRARRIDFLSRCRARLKHGGPLLLSFNSRGARSVQLQWIYQIARLVRGVRRCREPVEFGDSLFSTFSHYFARDEIRSELEAAGIELMAFSPSGDAVGRAK